MVPNPKDAEQAAQQARVLERAKAIALEMRKGGDYYAYQMNGEPGIYGVYKRSGSSKTDTAYLVDLNTNTCECPFHAENHYCKHIIGLNLMLDAIAEDERQEEATRLQTDADACQMDAQTYRAWAEANGERYFA